MTSLLNQTSEQTLQGTNNQSAGAFFASLGTSFAVFGAEVAIFILIKDKLPRLYQPRSYLVPERERAKSPPPGLWKWIIPTWKTSSVEIVHKCGLDAYFFLRYLAMLIKIFTPMMFTVLPILLCVNAIGGKGPNFSNETPYNKNTPTWGTQNQHDLNVLGWGNVKPDQAHRYWAHLILAVLVIAWCLYVFYDELRGFIRLRQAYLLSPQHRIRASATTVLVQAIPLKWCTVEALEGLFDVYPGGIRNIWVNRDYGNLHDLVKRRDNIANKLENAETQLIKKCRLAHLKMLEADAKSAGHKLSKKDRKATRLEETRRAKALAVKGESPGNAEDETPLTQNPASPGTRAYDRETTDGTPTEHDDDHPRLSTVDSRIDKDTTKAKPFDETYDAHNEGEPVWKRYIEEKDRPTMRLDLWNKGWLGWIPFTGEQVDTIDYCRKELARMTQQIEDKQQRPEEFPLMNSAFIQFNLQIAAHMACQSVTHHVPDQMAPRVVETSPGDIIWENMSFQWWERWLRTAIVTVVLVGLVVLFVIPSAIVGLLSQLTNLGHQYTWLNWVLRIPSWLLKAIQGILPAALTGLLLFLIPLIMRLLCKKKGNATGMLVELDVSDFYFLFVFIEVFLVITVSSGLLPLISSFNITGIPNLLASNVPAASNYYFSYLLLQGFSNSAGGLLQIVTLAFWFLWAPLNDSTARQKWKRQINLPTINWGSFFPSFTNLACIGLIYSIIAPLMIIFNLASFILFWFAYRYLTIYVDAFKYDTGGLLFPKAINQLFTGLYVMEICLIGLFFLVQGVDPVTGQAQGTPCAAQAIIMIVVLVLTVLYQIRMNLSFAPLFRYLPITLEDEAAERDESFALMQRNKFGTEYEGNVDERNAEEHELHEISHTQIEADVEKQQRQGEKQEVAQGQAPKAMEMERRKHEHDTIAAALRQNALDDREKIIYDNVATRGVLGIAKKPLQVVDLAKGQIDKGFDLVAAQQRQLQQRLNLRLPAGVEAGLNTHGALSDALFSGMHSGLDELSPAERDALTREAFKHAALRARRPVVWIPNDELGVAADEIRRTRQFSPFLNISSEGTALNGKGQVVFGKSPPDFRNEDLIEL